MFQLLKRLGKREIQMLCFSVVFIVAQVWLDLKIPDFMSSITKLAATPGTDIKEIWINGIYMLLCSLGSLLMAVSTGFFAAKVSAGFSKTLRENVFEKVLHFGGTEMGIFSSSSLITRTSSDVAEVQMLVAFGLQAFIKSPILLVWAILKISGKHWQWSLATAIAVVFVVLFLIIVFIMIFPYYRLLPKLSDKMNRVTRESLIGMRVVRAYNAESYQENKFEEVNEERNKTTLSANRIALAVQPTMTLVMHGVSLAVYWIGAHLISSAAVPLRVSLFSEMMVFSAYAMRIISAFVMMTMVFFILPSVLVAVKRINEVLQSGIAVQDGTAIAPKSDAGSEIEFRNVSFRYPGAGGDSLQNISFRIEKGETLAIIGATGSGKSTLVSLLPRFYDASQGEVLLDGVNVKEYSLCSLREKIGFALQKSVLFSGTVESNVCYGSESNASLMKESIQIAQADEFVNEMPEKEKSAIARGGSNVSGGQKQRLCIARAINRRPSVYIFDDSFSALDFKTDRRLRRALKEQLKGATKIIVAQRIGTIKNADRIIVLDEGRIVGVGTHKELLGNCQAYMDIAKFQLPQEDAKHA